MSTCPLECEATLHKCSILPCETHISVPDVAAKESEESRRCCDVIAVLSSRLLTPKSQCFQLDLKNDISVLSVNSTETREEEQLLFLSPPARKSVLKHADLVIAPF